MNRLFEGFVKVTALPIQAFYFRKKIYYEDKSLSNRKIKKGALIISNHMSVYDYPLMMYTFFTRVLRTLTAETMYEKNKFLTKLITRLGCIKVDRKNYNFSFMSEMVKCLKNNQVGLVFPESRLARDDEDPNILRDFKPSFVYMALEANVPIIPVYTNGIYGKNKRKYKDRARLIIGKPIYLDTLYDDNKSEKENIEFLSNYVRDKVLYLKDLLSSKVKRKVKENG